MTFTLGHYATMTLPLNGLMNINERGVNIIPYSFVLKYIAVVDPDCPGGWAPTLKVGVLTYFSGQKLHENERIRTPRRGLFPDATLDAVLYWTGSLTNSTFFKN